MAGIGGRTVKGQPTAVTVANTDQMLTTLALCNGNVSAARQRLAETGVRTSDKTLARVRDHHSELYQQRREELAPQLEQTFAADLLDNAANAAGVVKDLILETRRRLEEGTVEEPARSARELAQVIQMSVDKRLALQGRPSQITEVRDIAEILKALEGKGIVSVIDATAIEDDEKEQDDRDT